MIYSPEDKSEHKPEIAPAAGSSHYTGARSVVEHKDNRAGSAKKAQLAEQLVSAKKVVQKKANNTGLPDNLKSGIENLSGHSMDDVKVHYNSDKPAQLNAHAYAQGTDIHIASGQEKHLAHEAWHVVQQKQGRVKPTKQLKSKVNINDDVSLEKEADIMGSRATRISGMHLPEKEIPLATGVTSGGDVHNLKSLIQMVKTNLSLKSPVNNPGTPVQLIRITKDTVSDEVFQIYKELKPEARLLLQLDQTFHEFFVLSPAEQIDFLHALNSSVDIVNTLIQSHSRSIMGPQHGGSSLQQLQLQFLSNNRNFLTNLNEVMQGHTGVFHFSSTDSIAISSFSSLRTTGPSKDLSDKNSGVMVARPTYQFTIRSVMEQKGLSEFLYAQTLYQRTMRSMDDLISVGYEYEFASFAPPSGIYSDVEIIPSHQLMAKANKAGNYFGLSWRLESDSKNTLELVSPPLVFSRDSIGKTKSYAVGKELEKKVDGIATQMEQTHGTLPQTANQLASDGIGYGWKVNSRYNDFRVLTNKKSGKVYPQRNESMYPEEIGKLLVDKFKEEDLHSQPSHLPLLSINPTNVARLVRNQFLAKLPHTVEISDAVQQAIAVFSRYASNVLAIPSLRHRQDTGIRKDTMATDVKETLGVWVKTDALNVLMHLLKNPLDLQTFHAALEAAKVDILQIFTKAGQKFITDAQPPPVTPPTIQEISQQMNLLIQNGAQRNQATMNLAKQQLIAARTPLGPNPSIAVTGYVQEMIVDVTAFIQRALNVDQHQETNPKSTTSKFLEETFGTGEGIRKGTYIKGIPTSTGPMYVTEIR